MTDEQLNIRQIKALKKKRCSHCHDLRPCCSDLRPCCCSDLRPCCWQGCWQGCWVLSLLTPGFSCLCLDAWSLHCQAQAPESHLQGTLPLLPVPPHPHKSYWWFLLWRGCPCSTPACGHFPHPIWSFCRWLWTHQWRRSFLNWQRRPGCRGTSWHTWQAEGTPCSALSTIWGYHNWQQGGQQQQGSDTCSSPTALGWWLTQTKTGLIEWTGKTAFQLCKYSKLILKNELLRSFIRIYSKLILKNELLRIHIWKYSNFYLIWASTLKSSSSSSPSSPNTLVGPATSSSFSLIRSSTISL